MNRFADEYSFEGICDGVESLRIHDNPYDQFLFVKAVINVVRHELKQEKAKDVLRMVPLDEIARYTRLVLGEHPNLDSTMALIVATNSLKNELNKIAKITT